MMRTAGRASVAWEITGEMIGATSGHMVWPKASGARHFRVTGVGNLVQGDDCSGRSGVWVQSSEFVVSKDTLGDYDGGAIVAYWCVGLDYIFFKLLYTKTYDSNYEKNIHLRSIQT